MYMYMYIYSLDNIFPKKCRLQLNLNLTSQTSHLVASHGNIKLDCNLTVKMKQDTSGQMTEKPHLSQYTFYSPYSLH